MPKNTELNKFNYWDETFTANSPSAEQANLKYIAIINKTFFLIRTNKSIPTEDLTGLNVTAAMETIV